MTLRSLDVHDDDREHGRCHDKKRDKSARRCLLLVHREMPDVDRDHRDRKQEPRRRDDGGDKKMFPHDAAATSAGDQQSNRPDERQKETCDVAEHRSGLVCLPVHGGHHRYRLIGLTVYRR